MRAFFFVSFFFLLGCYKNHLYVQVENMGEDFLASYHVHTPDYRSKKPPIGQRIIVSWDFPNNLFQRNPSIRLTVRLWNNSQSIRIYKVHRRWGTRDFYFKNKKKDKKRRILTYKVDVVAENGEILETWKHQFWTELIDIDKDVL